MRRDSLPARAPSRRAVLPQRGLGLLRVHFQHELGNPLECHQVQVLGRLCSRSARHDASSAPPRRCLAPALVLVLARAVTISWTRRPRRSRQDEVGPPCDALDAAAEVVSVGGGEGEDLRPLGNRRQDGAQLVVVVPFQQAVGLVQDGAPHPAEGLGREPAQGAHREQAAGCRDEHAALRRVAKLLGDGGIVPGRLGRAADRAQDLQGPVPGPTRGPRRDLAHDKLVLQGELSGGRNDQGPRAFVCR
mmetsp:Transcript_2069/g.4739  ORF Transcript_2069/g.4739 Transcript_2069/m.4739 type:complete len:247 (-) Transcript_2069:735-1475(-)